jgi:large-conductance mechanosensitive channel
VVFLPFESDYLYGALVSGLNAKYIESQSLISIIESAVIALLIFLIVLAIQQYAKKRSVELDERIRKAIEKDRRERDAE